MTFAKRLRNHRNQTGETIDGFASTVGVSRATVLRWETGTAKPSNLSASRLRALGIEVAVEDTNAESIPVIDSNPEETYEDRRKRIRQKISLAGKTFDFLPAPYVINGPPDQLKFFEKLYKMQSTRRVIGETPEIASRSLSMVSEIGGLEVQTPQSLLENVAHNRKSWNGNYGSHGWHRYVGRFPPHLVRALLHTFGAQHGDTVCDPFAGSGTTLVEARLLGLNSIGVEISPLSALIARTKSTFPENADGILSLQSKFGQYYNERWEHGLGNRDPSTLSHSEVLNRPGNPIEHFKNIEKWFTPEALLGCSITVEFLSKIDGYEKDALAVALSAKMRSIGNVDVDVVRAEYRKEPRLGVDVLTLVQRQLRKMGTDIERMADTHRETIRDASSVTVVADSALDVKIPPGSIDYVITSPPYGVESLSYLRTHLLSFRVLRNLLGVDPYESDSRVIGSEYLNSDFELRGTHEAAKASPKFIDFFDQLVGDAGNLSRRESMRLRMMMGFFDDTVAFAERIAYWMAPGGLGAIVIGNKRLGERIIPTDEIYVEILNSCGLKVQEVVKHKLKTNNSNSQVPWQERTIQDEYVILFEKPR